MKKNITFQFFIFLLGCFLCTQAYAQQHKTEFTFSETVSTNLLRIMEANANAVFAEIHRAFYNQNTSGLTLSLSNVENNEAIQRIQNLWATSQFRCTETSVITRVLKSSNGYQVRNIPVYFEKADQEKYQNIVIEFTSSGKISDIYIALPEHQYAKIMGNSNKVEDLRQRQIILDFCENFRTAYNRKDLNLIEDVFSDDALIITGKVMQRQSKRGDMPVLISSPQIVYKEYNKKEYIDNLKLVFKRNSYINVKFDDIVVRQHDVKKFIYGVTLKQSWNSSTYNDEGWLFLLIDYKDENKPLIWVRTWQPFEDPVTKQKIHYNNEDIFGLSHFSF